VTPDVTARASARSLARVSLSEQGVGVPPPPTYGVGIRQAIRQRVTGSVSTLTDLADPEATPYGAQMCAFRGLLLTRAVNLPGLDL
jgi:hypothetical protein